MNTAPPKKILVRGVNWLGDAVMTTPALQRLREAFPDAAITLLTPEKLRGLWENHHAIDAVESFSKGESVWQVARRLREGNFDLGLTLPNSHRSALELWVARIPKRVGYSRPWRNFFLTQTVGMRREYVPMHKRTLAEVRRLVQANLAPGKYPISAHHIFQYLHLTAALGANAEPVAPQLFVGDATMAEFQNKFLPQVTGEKKTIWFGLNAGAEYGPAKRWPESRFIETAIGLQKRVRCRWMVFGLNADRELNARITNEINAASGSVFGDEKTKSATLAIDLTGKTTLSDLCAGLKTCRVVLTNDSGPMHLAAAVGTPVVVPFGSTSPELTGPGLPNDLRHKLLRANVACSPCFLRECPIDFRCMIEIPVEAVIVAVESAFHEGWL